MPTIAIQLSRNEVSEMKAEAHAAGVSLSAYCRSHLVGSPLSVACPCAMDRQAMEIINGIAPKVVRIQRQIENSGTADNRETVAEIAFTLVEIREALIAPRKLVGPQSGKTLSGPANTAIEVTLGSDEERQAIFDAAVSLGISISVWARSVLVTAPRVSGMTPITTERDRDWLSTVAVMMDRAACISPPPWHEIKGAVGPLIKIMDRLSPDAAVTTADVK